MIRKMHEAQCPESYLEEADVDPARALYFDIETTGLRAATSQLYMIGWAVREGPVWAVTQLMAESYREEKLLLDEFLPVLKKKDTLIEFNGNRFDIPYLKEKYASYKMGDPFEGIRALDIYQQIKPYKTLLGLQRLNQKSIEQFLKISREDRFNGGQLIDVYRSVRSRSAEDMEGAVRALFLHNYEDVLGMIAMTPVLSYAQIVSSRAPAKVRFLDSYGREVSDRQSRSGHFLEASFHLDVPVPISFEKDTDSYSVCAVKDSVYVTVPLLRRTMYHYFPDYRNYYYMPEEDMAIHKAVGMFVDTAHRKQATAKTCYIKKEGVFLPQNGEIFQPVFRREWKDNISWFELSDDFLKDNSRLSGWVHSLVKLT